MATAVGAAMLLYYVLSRRIGGKEQEDDRNGNFSKSLSRSGRRIARRPAQAPATWFETITTLSDTLRFTYSETLGKWPIGDLAFGINYLMRRQGNLQVASVYAGCNSVQLKGPEIIAELNYYLRLLTLCMLFSKKSFPVFLETAGYTQADVLLQKPKAGLLKPAFTILCDRNSKCILLLIRGTHSIKDTLTAATGAVVPFHHSVLHDGGIINLVLGYAHCGMVAAARWIAKLSTPFLLKSLEEYPSFNVKVGESYGVGVWRTIRNGWEVFKGNDNNLVWLETKNGVFSIKSFYTSLASRRVESFPHSIVWNFWAPIVGHSLGGGTAALLTYILREQKELSSTTCVTFAPGTYQSNMMLTFPFEHIQTACMTWDLAESGRHFITTVINGSDLVPTFSAVSVDDLRSEVTASSWLNDLRDQVQRTRVINVVYRSATALSSRLPSIASARARVSGAGALLRPVSSSTQVVTQNVTEAVVRTRSSLSSWSCMGARRRNVGSLPSPKEEDLPEASLISSEVTSESLVIEVGTRVSVVNKAECSSSSGGSGNDDTDEEVTLLPGDREVTTATTEDITDGELWYELEKELQRQEDEPDVQAQEEEAAAVIEITEEENMLADAVESKTPNSSDVSESLHFYPPGRIMHIISMPPSNDNDSVDNDTGAGPAEEHVAIYETPRNLYSKLRLSRTMIKDHFMPMYKKMMELLIRELENEEASSYVM
uniref:Fungal lipase-like domain-containing protein n=1 Tax=Vitis vinifera TaxID=29760 RepID=A5AH28_VITVI|nr:hypothetical protein VITISV_016049 [Vitis vinifera]